MVDSPARRSPLFLGEFFPRIAPLLRDPAVTVILVVAVVDTFAGFSRLRVRIFFERADAFFRIASPRAIHRGLDRLVIDVASFPAVFTDWWSVGWWPCRRLVLGCGFSPCV